MSPELQSAQLFVLAGLAFLLVGALVSAIPVSLLRRELPSWEPRARHRALAVLAALPVLIGLALLFAASLPSFVALVVPGLDHCPVHDDGHAHLCFVHLPEAGIRKGWMLVLVFLFSYGAIRSACAVSSVTRAVRVVTTLAETGEQRHDLGVTIVESAAPMCFVVGFLRPRILLSRGLFDSLGFAERAIILAHERAHVRRRDTLVASIVRVLAAFHLPGVGRWLVSELDVAAEQACDEEAAVAASDRVAVAAAILAVVRATQNVAVRQLGAVAAGFGERAVERRVAALLRDPVPPKSLRRLTAGLALALLGVLVVADELHHLTESLLALVAA